MGRAGVVSGLFAESASVGELGITVGELGPFLDGVDRGIAGFADGCLAFEQVPIPNSGAPCLPMFSQNLTCGALYSGRSRPNWSKMEVPTQTQNGYGKQDKSAFV